MSVNQQLTKWIAVFAGINNLDIKGKVDYFYIWGEEVCLEYTSYSGTSLSTVVPCD